MIYKSQNFVMSKLLAASQNLALFFGESCLVCIVVHNHKKNTDFSTSQKRANRLF